MYPEEIVGAVYLLGNIYVIAKGSFHVLVLSGHSPYDLTDKIHLDGMDAVDIAVSYADICVYVLDGNGRVSRIGQDHSLSTAVDGLERGNLRSMSVTMDGRFVIVKRNSVISTYGKDGSLISVISDPPLKPIIHAVEVASNTFVVCTESIVAKITKEDILLQCMDVGSSYISVDRARNLIACDMLKHHVTELDSESLAVHDTLLTLDRDGIANPQHVQCVLENGMMLVSWMNCLDVYSSGQKATHGYLASTKDETREQQTLEAELLEGFIAHYNDAFRSLVNLYTAAGMDSVFGDLPMELQTLPSTFTLTFAHPPGKEIMQRRVQQDDMNRMFSLLSGQSWAAQYYHDIDNDVVRIGVDTPYKEEADRCLREAFPHDHDLYEICDPWQCSYQPGMNVPGISCSSKLFQQCQTELGPSTRISCGKGFFLFSGAVTNSERGLTVAHATKPGKEIALYSSQASSDAERTIGQCLETYGNLEQRSGEKLSADLALLKLNSKTCLVNNTVRWPIPSGKTLRIKLYKGQKVPDDTAVMILDKNGNFQYGSIRRDHLTDKKLQDEKLHNVLAISAKKGEKEVSITQQGDSGALVMSLPSNESELVYVYGIATGIYTNDNNNNDGPESLTVANSLWDVIYELCINSDYRTDLRNNTPDDIDFV